jgi:sulfhydrogenase subunit alpha
MDIRTDVDATVDLFASLDWPDFERDTEYISLTKPDEYAFIDGQLKSSDGGMIPPEQYKEMLQEFMVEHSTAKYSRHLRDGYMVGALARFNNNYKQLHPRAKKAASKLGMQPKVTNPYLNSGAQVVEIVHCIEDAILVIDQLLDMGVQKEELIPIALYDSQGVGACEVPRGLLIHHYWIGKDGRMTGANCIIPTNQNYANLEADMRELVPQIMDKSVEAIQKDLEMLVRAYDPCISCSVHVLVVDG